jgi:hypothetical protein
MKNDLERILKEAAIFAVVVGSIYLAATYVKPCLNYVKQEGYKIIQEFNNSIYFKQK